MNMYKLFVTVALVCIMAVGASPSFAADPTSGSSQSASGNVTSLVAITTLWNGNEGSDIDFGNLVANNVAATFSGNETVKDYSNVPIALSTYASGALLGSSESIPLENMLYSDYGNSVPDTAFTTTPSAVKSWNTPDQASTPTTPVTYKITVPWNTKPGTYTTTIYHVAQAAT